jgi:hypothetical protein
MANIMKNLQSGWSKLFSGKMIPILIIIFIVVVLFYYSSSKGSVLDKMTGVGAPTAMGPSMPPSMSPPPSAPAVAPNAPASTGYQLQPIANPEDLLPKDQNSQWAALNPMGNQINTPDLLTAGYHIGLDTIGQTLKNANYQLRSDPIIEKRDIGPWMQSTIEPDYGRVPLEMGTTGR